MSTSADTLIASLQAPPARRAPGFRSWLADQSAERQAALAAAAVDDRWSTAALTQLLKDAKAPCSKDTIGAWRRELGYRG